MFTLNKQVTITYGSIRHALTAASLLAIELKRSVQIYKNGELVRLLRY